MKQYLLARVFTVLAVLTVIQFAHAEKAKTLNSTEMTARLTSLVQLDAEAETGRISVVSIGQSVKGKPIWMVKVSDPKADPVTQKKLFIICRQHGDEPASTEAMIKVISDLVKSTDEYNAELLKKVAFYIVPMMNPDGADSAKRRNANDADLNRDWITLVQPETQSVRAAIDAVVPDILIDQHELSPGNRTTDFIETTGIKSGASKEVVTESAQLQNLVIGMMRTHELYVRSCQVEDKNPARLAHRYFPIKAGTKTLLFETKQQGIRQYMLVERMKLHIVGTMTVAKYLAGQEDELRQRIASHDEWRHSVQMASRKGRTTSRTTTRR